jgi:hypothetical protein
VQESQEKMTMDMSKWLEIIPGVPADGGLAKTPDIMFAKVESDLF